MELQGKRALVTGATGFIGSHLAKRLVAEGVQVRALVRQPEKGGQLARWGIELVSGDITVPASLTPAMQDCQVVFHAAAWVSESGAKANVWAVNVEGTQNMVEAAAAAGVERFVHLSSCAVYGSLQKFCQKCWCYRLCQGTAEVRHRPEDSRLGFATGQLRVQAGEAPFSLVPFDLAGDR